MRERGLISKVVNKKGYYEVQTDSGAHYILNFDDCNSQNYLIGDLISFLPDFVNLQAKSPNKLRNTIFDQLKALVGTGETISAFVYEQKKHGFNVSYQGYNCFLPFSETLYENTKLTEFNQILGTYQDMEVSEIKNDFVMLSRKRLLKATLQELQQTELESLHAGDQFEGTIKEVVNYGLFVTCQYTEGLLHIRNLIPTYKHPCPKDLMKVYGQAINATFRKGMKILVTIDEISQGRFTLNWNENLPDNRALLKSLEQQITSYSL